MALPTTKAPIVETHAYRPLTAMKRALLIAVGTIALSLGILGTLLPGLPTTPFIVITLLCYVRSSDRLYRWVITRRWLQKPVRAALRFIERRALPVPIKLVSVGAAWASAVVTVVTEAALSTQLAVLIAAGAASLAMVLIRTEQG
ncbi:MAG: YbaN family protein [Anaerolineae bacterium]|nr:YbaN family protein [Thermoflexales bacterium]MDW8054291.1 YbaN family protein [Anaerolineae bacterium]